MFNSGSSSCSTSSSSSTNISDSPHLSENDTTKVMTTEIDSNSEENLIESLKKSLHLTDNKFLESEIEDLKDFFTVQFTDDYELGKSLGLKIFLPVTVRIIDETEVISFTMRTGKPAISLKIELKRDEKGIETDDSRRDELPYSITDFKVEEVGSSNVVSSEVSSIVGSSDVLDTVAPIHSPLLSRVNLILSQLLKRPETSLLSLIEDFYIKLEELNYPQKEVVYRDYYYPVFDERHWGRSRKSTNISGSGSGSGGSGSLSLFSFLANINNNTKSTSSSTCSINNTNNYNSNNNNISNNNYTISSPSLSSSSPNSQSISIYQARALYDFQALMQGELSFQENEVLLVLANLGNGWLTARRVSSTSDSSNCSASVLLDSDDSNVGLIPENYIERLFD